MNGRFLRSVLMTVMVLSGPHPEPAGRFLRLWWFEPGLEHGNPMLTKRFRVNAPEVVLHPEFGRRSEARSGGMLQILMDEDLTRLANAELYLELWGGHPGTARRRVTPNGRTTYVLPNPAGEHCSHAYPTVRLSRTDLVRGYNALQFACDQGASFWGHFIVDEACLRAELGPDHPDLDRAGLGTFSAAVAASPSRSGAEAIELSLEVHSDRRDRIASVDFEGYYRGFDENGDGLQADWHGFTKRRRPVAHLGTSSGPPFAISWDVSMLPTQRQLAARAVVRFRDHPELIYVTSPKRGLATPDRPGVEISIRHPVDLPQPFWSRADQEKTCTIDLDVDPGRIERAELHIVIWDGGAGAVEDYFTLNGRPLPVAGRGAHDVIYRRHAIDPVLLRRGPNRIALRSDTEHHGIEVLLPGPALVIRARE